MNVAAGGRGRPAGLAGPEGAPGPGSRTRFVEVTLDIAATNDAVEVRVRGEEITQVDEFPAGTYTGMALVGRGLASGADQLDLEKRVGDSLFGAGVGPHVAALYHKLSPTDELLLRLVIPVDNPASEVPWEVARHVKLGNTPLFLLHQMHVVRSVENELAPPRPVDRLKVLVASCWRAPGLTELNVEYEINAIRAASRAATEAGLPVDIEIIGESVSSQDLEAAVVMYQPNFLHLICHGFPAGHRRGQGVALADKDVPPDELARITRRSDVQGVVLSCCSGTGSPGGAKSIAHKLLEHGVRAVVGMQHEINDATGLRFAQGFYPSFFTGSTVQQAVRDGRESVGAMYFAGSQWAVPAVYLRDTDGQIYRPDPGWAATLRFTTPTARIDNLHTVPKLGKLLGRGRELDGLEEGLTEEAADRRGAPQVIAGEPGMGKSSLAIALAQRVLDDYAAVWWIDARTEPMIRDGLRAFARKLLANTMPAEVESEEGSGAVPQFLTDLNDFLDSPVLQGRALVIFDNVDDVSVKIRLREIALDHLPARTCDVLITSQDEDWGPYAVTHLRGLTPEAGALLVASSSRRPDLAGNSEIEQISTTFDGRPLLLNAVAALFEDGEDPEMFLLRLEESDDDAMGALPDQTGLRPPWRETYRVALAAADQAASGCRELVETLAFLAGEPVPPDLVRSLTDTPRIDNIIRTLAKRSLIGLTNPADLQHSSTIMHRTIGAIVRMNTREEDRGLERLNTAARGVQECLPRREDIRAGLEDTRMAALGPHIQVIGELAGELAGSSANDTREAAAVSASMLGIYQRTRSEWAAAEASLRKSVQLSISDDGRALRQVRLANVIRQRGRFEEAKSILVDALPIVDETAGPRDRAWALTVLARTLRAQPDSSPVEALPKLDAAMQLISQAPDFKSKAAQRQLSELYGYRSVLNRQLSKLDVCERDAIAGLRVITGMSPEEVLHAEQPIEDVLVATHLRALGGLWRLRGNFELAMQAHKTAVRGFERLGENHTDVGRALDSLGRVQREWGDLDGAVESFQRAKKISDLRFGPNYPHAATALVNLALVELERHQAEDALEQAQAGVDIYCMAYDETFQVDGGAPLRNFDTGWAVFVRANALLALGCIDEARRDHELVLGWRQAEHKYQAVTASSLFAVGEAKICAGVRDRDQSLIDQGRGDHDKALDLRLAVFGDEPDYWLAQSQVRVGEIEGNLGLILKGHAAFTAQLRPGHWRTESAAVSALTAALTGRGVLPPLD